MRWTGGQLAMRQRAAPATVPVRAAGAQADNKPSVFVLRSCEAPLPAGADNVQVGALTRLSPHQNPQRIVLLADTGCRMKQSEAAFQDCNDAAHWPLAALARSAAAQRPDLVIHMGDLHYRESPCPDGRSGCAGSPWGYGDDAWQADFFKPAAPLLAAAPWLFVRGNHESCTRAGVGWFRYLDARDSRPTMSCEDPANDASAEFTEPFAVPLGDDTQLIVFDSAFSSGRAYMPTDPAFVRYTAQMQQVARLATGRPHNLFLNHHPVLAFGGSANGAPKPGSAGLHSVLATSSPQHLFPAGIDAVLNGHVHLFEALDFSSPHPAELLVGNGGSAMEGRLDAAAARKAQPAPGAVVRTLVTHPSFGFATLERNGTRWNITAWSVDGQALQRCTLDGSRLDCAPGQ
jgi:hypothetical protein